MLQQINTKLSRSREAHILYCALFLARCGPDAFSSESSRVESLIPSAIHLEVSHLAGKSVMRVSQEIPLTPTAM